MMELKKGQKKKNYKNITNVQLFIPEDNIQQANMFKNLGFKPGTGSWLEYLFEE